MSTQAAPLTGSLEVSSKVLGHISEGLYRGPAGVFKELISNAFDANATTVRISTGRPTFDVVSVTDDGDGMSLDKFKELVSGGIGDSDKRSGHISLINGRQVIGRLGIGILGVSQISHEFSIVSHSRADETAFQANVKMKDFRREVLDRPELTPPSSELQMQDASRNFTVGTYEAVEIPFESRKHGLTITATDPTEGFRRQLSEDNPGPLPKSFSAFGEWAGIKDNLATGTWYKRVIWQVASLSPVPYIPESIIPKGAASIAKMARTLDGFDFSVIIDGVKIFKPVSLDGPTIEISRETTVEHGGPFHFPLEFDQTVWGSRVRVLGYLYGSDGSALHPDDLRGILIRLKHVGIGEYDKSFLGYRYAEGPRFAWLTGELFVQEGLEDALTVGRDGFDVGHPHYIAIRRWLHQELRSRVFPALIKGIAVRRAAREGVRNTLHTAAFLEAIAHFAGSEIDIIDVDERGVPPVAVDLGEGTATINHAAKWPRGKRQRELAQRLSIMFELVRTVDSDDEPTEVFLGLIGQLLVQR